MKKLIPIICILSGLVAQAQVNYIVKFDSAGQTIVPGDTITYKIVARDNDSKNAFYEFQTAKLAFGIIGDKFDSSAAGIVFKLDELPRIGDTAVIKTIMPTLPARFDGKQTFGGLVFKYDQPTVPIKEQIVGIKNGNDFIYSPSAVAVQDQMLDSNKEVLQYIELNGSVITHPKGMTIVIYTDRTRSKVIFE